MILKSSCLHLHLICIDTDIDIAAERSAKRRCLGSNVLCVMQPATRNTIGIGSSPSYDGQLLPSCPKILGLCLQHLELSMA